MGKPRQLVLATVIGAALLGGGPWPSEAADTILLRTGEIAAGDLDDADLTLQTPQGPFRVTRDTSWRVILNLGTTGDSVLLRNGNRLSGIVDRGRYTLRVSGDQTRTFDRSEIGAITLGAAGAPSGRTADTLILRNGDSIYGDLTATEFALAAPSGTYRFQRDTVWRIFLGSAAGDALYLANGDRLSGIVDQPSYAVRTPDGQVMEFGRDVVKEVMLRSPERPGAAAGPGPGAVGPGAPSGPVTPSGPVAVAPPTAAVPPTPVPAALRAVLRDLQFEFDRWDLTSESRKTLEDVATGMKAYPALRLLIEGHADERGTAEYNLALGARRAQTARDYLVTLGIEPGRLDMISYGEEKPLDPGHNELAWSLNRRAHFVVKAQ
ncbi:MAG TPA: OmpA family protein [Methylomirabilota bacterium]|jgi:peptidoglycan-associated lipoprotein|nr:OmpA family protein [Methylomirabilota bacterium]